MPSLRQLEYIVELSDSGQFVETARKCAVSQPALSKQIREVEESLGVVLFERARPRVLVTPIGREVVRRARQILLQAKELEDAAVASQALPRGTFRLGVIPTIAPYGLPGLLTRLRDLYPEALFAIFERQTDILLEELRLGQIDLCLLARPIPNEGLKGTDLVHEPFVLVGPTDHVLRGSDAVSIEDVTGADLILMEDGHCLREQAMEVCALANSPRQLKVAAGSISTLVRMVESGLGATLIPASALSSEVSKNEAVFARSFSGPQPGRTLTLQWRASSPNANWFREIAEVLRAHYLGMNANLCKIAGPPPRMRSVDQDATAHAGD